MARSRNIKPGFFTNDVLGELPPLTRLLFAGLWTICDRDGRIEDRPKKIRAELLPYDDCDPEEMLQALENKGFILRYQAGEIRAIQVLAWEKHQNPHVKEAASTIQAPDNNQTSTRQAHALPERAGLIPSSLIPDSSPLIPDCSTDVDGAGKPRKPAKPAISKPDDVEQQTWADWLTLRKAKKAPVTETVLNGAKAEAGKAGMTLDAFLQVWCRRGSQGLEADWLKPSERQTASRVQVSFSQQDEAARRKRWEEMTGRKWPTGGSVFDVEDDQQRIAS